MSNCLCDSQKPIRIYKGFPTKWGGQSLITAIFVSKIDLTGFKAYFKVGNIVKQFDDITDKIYIDLTAEETGSLDVGLNYATLEVEDRESHKKPFSTEIPLYNATFADGDIELDSFEFNITTKIQENILKIRIETNAEAVSSHDKLLNRDLPDQHPMSAITGLSVKIESLEQADIDLQANKVEKTTEANKIYGTDSNGEQTTYDFNSFGKVDDVKVGDTSVVQNKIALLGTMAGETATNYRKSADQDTIDSGIDKKITDHIADKDNPHEVNKTDVGLGNVQNIDTTNASNITSGTLSNDRLGTIPYDKLSGVASAGQGQKADTAVQNLGDLGITATATEINYTKGVTSAIQTQINSKQANITESNKLSATLISDDSTHRFVSDAEKTNWNNKQPTIDDIATIRTNAQAGKNASDTIATYGNIVTHNTSEFYASTNPNGYQNATQVNTAISTHNQDAESHSDIRADIDALDKRIDETLVPKTVNAIIIGEPTITNSQVSGFSQTSYLALPFLFDVGDRGFEFTYCFRTGEDITTPQNHFGSKFSIASYIANGKLTTRVSSNGTSWDVLDLETSLTIAKNSIYYIKIIFNKLNYVIKASTNGVEYNEIARVVDTRHPFAGDVTIGIGNNQNNPFKGILYMNAWGLKYNNSVYWEGMDDAGLATRADISLSNLDADGEARFTAKQDKIDDLEAIRSGASLGATALQSITSTNVINALGYTPYNSTNPSGYQTQGQVNTAVSNHNADKTAHGNIIAKVDANTQKIEELIVARFPNAIIIGTPHIEGGQVSGFTSSNYLQFPFIDISRGLPFDIYFSFTTTQDVQTQQNVLDAYFGIALAIQNGKGVMALSSNGSSWDIGTAVGTNTLLPNTTYYVKYSWTGTKYSASLSTDESSYVPDMNLDSTLSPHKTTIYIGGSPNIFGAGSAHPFKGTINFNKSKVVVNGITVWEGMADVGLASRANVSLSNLDVAGEARFNSKQDLITDLSAIRTGAGLGATALQSISSSDVTGALGYTPADDSDVVKLTGNQTVGGNKTFTGNNTFNNEIAVKSSSQFSFRSYQTDIERGVAPSSYQGSFLNINIDKSTRRLSGVLNEYQTTMRNSISILAYKGFSTDASDFGTARLMVGFNADGSKFTEAPTPTENTTTSTQIDTVGARNTKLSNYRTFIDQNVIDATKQPISTALNYDNVSNCITEIPQDIKLELNNGTLTLKSGSKVYVPNGANTFDVVNITSDKTTTSTTNGKVIVLTSSSGGTLTANVALERCVSGSTDGLLGTPFHVWYDTTNNVVNYYGADGTTSSGTRTLPIAIANVSDRQITSIDQVFNGFGYIGSTVFALPGVKGLIPNGRNADGSLKNTEFTTQSVLTVSSGLTRKGKLFCKSNELLFVISPSYDEYKNYNYNYGLSFYCDCGNLEYVSGRVDSFTPKTTFHAVDYSELNSKQDVITDSNKLSATLISDDATHRFVSDTDKTNWNNKLSSITSSMVTTALGFTPYNATNPSGYITSSALNGYATQQWVGQQGFIKGITSADVTTALGFTPYNSANPAGYITSSYHDSTKQDNLVSGTNIKTVNGSSLLGSGDLTVEADMANSVKDQNHTTVGIKTWTGTLAEYNAITTKDANILYNITDDNDVSLELLKKIYPVGSTYFTKNLSCPLEELFGTWELDMQGGFVTNVDSTATVQGTGMTLGLTNGSDKNGGLVSASDGRLGHNLNSYGMELPASGQSTTGFGSGSLAGITTDPTKSGMIANVSSQKFQLNCFVRIA